MHASSKAVVSPRSSNSLGPDCGLHGVKKTAIALGSSAIVMVSEQNCFRTLYGSLGQIHLGLPEGSAGSSNVPPSSKFRCLSGLLGQPRTPFSSKITLLIFLLIFSPTFVQLACSSCEEPKLPLPGKFQDAAN